MSPPPPRTLWSSRKLARQVGTSWRLHRTMASNLQVHCRGGKHSPLKCQRQSQARSLIPHLPRTSWSSRTLARPAARLLNQSEIHHGGGSVAKAITCRCVVLVASTLHESAGRQRRARTLRPPVPRIVERPPALWRLRWKTKHLQVSGLGHKHSNTCRQAETSTHL